MGRHVMILILYAPWLDYSMPYSSTMTQEDGLNGPKYIVWKDVKDWLYITLVIYTEYDTMEMDVNTR